MMNVKKFPQARGLVWRQRGGALLAYWVCPASKVKRGFPIKSRLLWRGTEPTILDTENIVLSCRQMSREVKDFIKNPEQRRPSPHFSKRGHIYFVRSSSQIKIGFSTNVDKRIRTLQAASGHQVELLSSRAGTPDLEKVIHERFRHLRQHGEWFREAPELLSYIEETNACRTQNSNVLERASSTT